MTRYLTTGHLTPHSPLALLVTCMAFAISLTSCSIFFSDSSDPQHLSLSVASDQNWSIESIQENPALYRLTSRELDSTDSYYLTSIKDCSFNKPISTQVTTRQLLVGLTNIHIRHQEKLELGQTPLLISILEADLDSEPLLMACYTVQQGNCITDVVVWSAETMPDKIRPHLQMTKLVDLAETLFPAVIN